MSNGFDDSAYNKGLQSSRTMGNLGGALWAGTTGGTANNYTLILPGVDAYVTGLCFFCKFNIVSSGASVININGLGNKTIQVAGAAVSTDLAVAKTFLLVYDSNGVFQALN